MTSADFAAWMAAHGLKTRDAAALLGVSMRAVQGWRSGEHGPPHNIIASCAAINLIAELWCRTWRGIPDGWRDELRSRVEKA